LAAICRQYARKFGKLCKDKHMNVVNVYENLKRWQTLIGKEYETGTYTSYCRE
jgi:hypothetical protein